MAKSKAEQRKHDRKKKERRRRRKRALSGALPIVGLSLVAAIVIGYLAWGALNRDPQASCLMLIDRTSSSNRPETVDRYKSQAALALDGCTERNAELAVFYFDQSAAKIIQATQQSGLINLRDRSGFGEAEDSIEQVFASTGDEKYASDILVPLDQAADELQAMRSSSGSKSAHLILLSDGLHRGSEVSVDLIAESPSSIDPLVLRANELGLVPNLQDVNVDIVGVRSGQDPETNEATVDWFEPNVELFWREIIDQADGQLCRYSTDPTALPSDC